MIANANRRTAIGLGLGAALFPPCLVAEEAMFELPEFLALSPEAFRPWLPAENPRGHVALIRAIAAQASRISEISMPEMFPMGAGAPGIEIGPIGRGPQFAVIAYRAAPNAVLPAHNHPNYSVATLGVSGEAMVSQFEVDAAAPPMSSSDVFHVRKTSQRLLRRSDLATLAPTADNIHTFVAGPSGAAWIDIAVPNGPDVGFAYLRMDERADTIVGERLRVRWRAP